jgi:phage tail protein X
MANLYRNLRLPVLILALCCATGGSARGGEGSRPPCWHRVRRGETLAKIARKYYGRTKAWTRIKRANRGLNEHNLKIGQRIFIPTASGTAVPLTPTPAPEPVLPPEVSSAESSAPVAGEILAHVLSTLIGLPFSFLYECLLLWLASRLMRRAFHIRQPTFGNALRGAFFAYLANFGAMLCGFILALPVFFLISDYPTAAIIYGVIVAVATIGLMIWATCAVLARNYKLTRLEGFALLIVWSLLGMVIGCCLSLIGYLILIVIVGGSIALMG